MSSLDTEALAEGLAAQGREELIDRFREAYAKALGTHSDLVSFDSERVEAMVQRSAEEADGLQWRRALAGVAARELGIDLGPALTHPAVVRAHQLVGAPTYESALAALAVPAPLPETPAAPTPPPAVAAPVPPEPDLATVAAEEPFAAEEAEPDAVEVEELAEVEELIAIEEAAELAEAEELAEVAAELAEEDLAAAESTDSEELILEAELATVMPSASVEAEPELKEEPALDVEEEPEADAVAEAPVTSDPAAVSLLDQPTMAYDALEPEEEPSDEVLAHRAAGFAEEFMASAPAVPGDEPPVSDEFTFEQDALDVPEIDQEVSAAAPEVAEFGAVHLGGVATLPSAEEIALRLSEDGLDLLQDDGTIVGRLGWTEIAALEVTVPHGRRRRRNAPRLVVHTAGGSARFEVPGLSGEELQDQVQPLMARFGS